MKVVIGSKSPVKAEAVRRGFQGLFPEIAFVFECVPADSGISAQPMSHAEMRTGALGRAKHARLLSPEADFYVGLEGGVEELHGDLYNYGWVIVESKDNKQGWGQTFGFALPPAIRDLILHEGLEQSDATDKVFEKLGASTSTGTIGPLTKDFITYTDWYVPAVIGALVPFANKLLY